MRVIGITGGIGSGKSYISRLLTDHFNIPVFNCDIQAHHLTLHDAAIRKSLTALLGSQVYLPDGTLNKALMADFMFRQHRAHQVNAIIHPAVRNCFCLWQDSLAHTSAPLALGEGRTLCTTPVVAIESAILVEAGFTDLCTQVWLVTAPLELRISRAMQRDHATRQQVLDRISAQTTDAERIKHASHVIVNDGAGNILSSLRSLLSNL